MPDLPPVVLPEPDDDDDDDELEELPHAASARTEPSAVKTVKSDLVFLLIGSPPPSLRSRRKSNSQSADLGSPTAALINPQHEAHPPTRVVAWGPLPYVESCRAALAAWSMFGAPRGSGKLGRRPAREVIRCVCSRSQQPSSRSPPVRRARRSKVNWMAGFPAAGTPSKYNKVGVIKVGPRSAKNVLVLEPGTSAGGAYFVPLAKWIVVESAGLAGVVGRAAREPARGPVGAEPGQAAQATRRPSCSTTTSATWRTRPSRSTSSSIPNSTVEFAKQWGMKVAVEDLHR